MTQAPPPTDPYAADAVAPPRFLPGRSWPPRVNRGDPLSAKGWSDGARGWVAWLPHGLTQMAVTGGFVGIGLVVAGAKLVAVTGSAVSIAVLTAPAAIRIGAPLGSASGGSD